MCPYCVDPIFDGHKKVLGEIHLDKIGKCKILWDIFTEQSLYASNFQQPFTPFLVQNQPIFSWEK